MTDNSSECLLPTVGVVGLGRMGNALAERLAAHGIRVYGWTRSGLTEEKATTLGISACEDLDSLASQSTLIILSLLDDAAVTGVIGDLLNHDLSGKLIVDTSTVSPDTLRALFPKIRDAGAGAVDAPIAGGPGMVLDGTAGYYVGGSADDMDTFRPVASLLSERVIHVGGLGDGAAAKIVNNMMLAGFWQSLKEAVEVGKASGLSLEAMIELLSESPVSNGAFLHRRPVLLGESETVGFSVNGVIKDIALFQKTAAALGVITPTMDAAIDSFIAHREAGHGEADLVTMVRAAYLAK